MKTQPMAHQVEALNLMKDKKYYALFMEQGTGKTKVAIDDMSYLFESMQVERVLVIAPNGVHRNWMDELDKHCSAQYKAHCYQSTMGKAAIRDLTSLISTVDATQLSILVMNVEAFSSKKGVTYATSFANNGRTCIIIDESSRIKTPGAKRTKEITKIGRLCEFRRILTGTPVTNSPLDVFTQMNFLSDRILGQRSFYAFRARYAVVLPTQMGGRTIQLVKGFRNLDELTEKVARYSYRVLKEDCLDLPEKVYKKVYVQLGAEQKRIYAQLVTDMRSALCEGEVTVQIALTKLLRLQQITGGYITNDDGDLITLKDSKRLSCFMDIIGDTLGKVLIWSRFTPEIRAIIKALKDKYGDESVVDYFGATTKTDRLDAVDRIQNDPQTRFFVANPHSAGIGLTLTAAETTIYYSNDFSLETRLQSEDRNHRHGTVNKVTYVDIVAENTVDEKVLDALMNKKNIADLITGDVKGFL